MLSKINDKLKITCKPYTRDILLHFISVCSVSSSCCCLNASLSPWMSTDFSDSNPHFPDVSSLSHLLRELLLTLFPSSHPSNPVPLLTLRQWGCFFFHSGKKKDSSEKSIIIPWQPCLHLSPGSSHQWWRMVLSSCLRPQDPPVSPRSVSPLYWLIHFCIQTCCNISH